MDLSVLLGGRWYGVGGTRWYGRYHPPIRKYKVEIERLEKYVRLSFRNENRPAWHQGGDLEMPLNVAKRLGALLVASFFRVKSNQKKPLVFHVQEGPRKIRIRT